MHAVHQEGPNLSIKGVRVQSFFNSTHPHLAQSIHAWCMLLPPVYFIFWSCPHEFPLLGQKLCVKEGAKDRERQTATHTTHARATTTQFHGKVESWKWTRGNNPKKFSTAAWGVWHAKSLAVGAVQRMEAATELAQVASSLATLHANGVDASVACHLIAQGCPELWRRWCRLGKPVLAFQTDTDRRCQHRDGDSGFIALCASCPELLIVNRSSDKTVLVGVATAQLSSAASARGRQIFEHTVAEARGKILRAIVRGAVKYRAYAHAKGTAVDLVRGAIDGCKEHKGPASPTWDHDISVWIPTMWVVQKLAKKLYMYGELVRPLSKGDDASRTDKKEYLCCLFRDLLHEPNASHFFEWRDRSHSHTGDRGERKEARALSTSPRPNQNPCNAHIRLLGCARSLACGVYGDDEPDDDGDSHSQFHAHPSNPHTTRTSPANTLPAIGSTLSAHAARQAEVGGRGRCADRVRCCCVLRPKLAVLATHGCANWRYRRRARHTDYRRHPSARV